MLKKVCTYCGGVSFSARESGKWLCPHCGEDITAVEVESARLERLPEKIAGQKEISKRRDKGEGQG